MFFTRSTFCWRVRLTWRVGYPVLVIVAADLGLTLYVPSLARIEVETLRPAATVLLEDLTSSSHVVVGRLDPDAATADEELLAHADTFDVTAAWVVSGARHAALTLNT